MLLSYVPRFAAQFLKDSSAPSYLRVNGTVSVADISGFTRKAAALSQVAENSGSESGAEAIQALVNAIFEPVVDAIIANSGDVVCFAGDAVVAFWPGDAGAGEAKSAAAAIQKALAANNAAVASEFEVRSALVSGDFWMVSVGSDSRWYPLLGGEGFSKLASLLLDAKHTGLALCPLTQKRARDRVELQQQTRVRAEAPMLVADIESPEFERDLQPFVVPALRAQSDYEYGGWLAELRQASIAFVTLEGDLASSADIDVLQYFAASVSETAARHDGAVNQIVVDDKGLVAVVAFGVAGHVHEDDARRCVVFGMELEELLATNKIVCKIGIASGRVFCGMRGGKQRSDLAVIGHSVNHAARLMAASPGIAIDESTQRAIAGSIDALELHGLTLKNMPPDTRAFQPQRLTVGAQKVPGSNMLLEGRIAEQRALTAALQELKQSRKGGLWLVHGAAGIGKSALIEHCVSQFVESGARVLRGQADVIALATPYYCWRTVLLDLLQGLGISSHFEAAAVKSALARLVPGDLAGTLGLLNPMLPVALNESVQSSSLGPEARVEATRDLLVALLKELAGQAPLTLVIEDGHWLDDLSLAALMAVSERVPDLLLVISSRPDSPRLEDFIDEARGHRLNLSELGAEATARILCQELGVTTLPPDLADFVFFRTGGHPLFVQQIAGSLRIHPAIELEAGECRLKRHAQLDDLALPQSIAAVVTSTLDKLSLEQQIVLKVMAVVGRPVTPAQLEQLLPDNVAQQKPWLSFNPSITRQLLSANERNLDFRHALIRQSIYEVLTRAQRTALHGGYVDLLEAEHRESESEVAVLDVLAYHNEHAGRLDRAVDLLERAGRRALIENTAPLDAIRSLEHLLALEAAHPEIKSVAVERIRLPGRFKRQNMHTRRAHWQRLLGESYAKIGETTPSVEHLGRALTELGVRLPLPRHKVAQAFGQGLVPRLLLPPKKINPSRLNSSERRAVVELVAAHDRYTRLCYTRGESAQGVASAMRATELAERLGVSSELCNSYCMMSNVTASFGRFAIARRYTALASDAAEKLGEPALLALTQSLPYLWVTTLWDPEALTPLQRAVGLFDSLGDRQSAALFSCYVARLYMLAGNYDRSVEELEAMNERVQEGGASHLQIRCELNRGEIEYRRNNFAGAREWAMYAQATHKEFGERDYTVAFQLQGMLALLAGNSGDTAAAVHHAALAREALAKGGAGSFFPHLGFVGIFETLFAQLRREPEQTKHLLNDHKQAFKTLQSQQRTRPYVRPLYYLYRAEVKLLTNKVSAAKRLLTRGLSHAEGLNGPWEIRLLERALNKLDKK